MTTGFQSLISMRCDKVRLRGTVWSYTELILMVTDRKQAACYTLNHWFWGIILFLPTLSSIMKMDRDRRTEGKSKFST